MSDEIKLSEEEAVTDRISVKISKQAKNDTKISLAQYFSMYADSVHPYTQSYVSANYHGIMKTKDEWEAELIGKY